MDLSAGQDDLQWIAQCVNQGVDLGAQAAFASANRLISTTSWGSRTVLMCPYNGAVDHRVFVVGIDCQQDEDPGPHSAHRPAAEAPVGVVPAAQAFREVAPRNAGAIPVQ